MAFSFFLDKNETKRIKHPPSILQRLPVHIFLECTTRPNGFLAILLSMKKIVLFVLCLWNTLGFSQGKMEIPKGYFSPPVDIPMLLAGSFGEMRTNHFHTGIDIKTQGKIGLPIHAIDDGWVSRIRVSLSGYGNAVYIDHPNGFTSVYAHLSKFNDEIAAFLKNAQYDLETYVIDLYPAQGKIHVSRDEIIAQSGNTGRSGGPHLHFEIRETKSELPVNPLLFGFDIPDHKSPKAYTVMAIPLDENAAINGNSIQEVIGSKLGTAYQVKGKVGFAIKTYDFFDGTRNQCGTFRVKLYRNDQLVYSHVLDQLDFYTNRFVNAHVVYDYFKKNKSRFQRSYRLPFDELPFYERVLDKNQWNHLPDSIYHYRYVLEDYAGNLTQVNFTVKGIKQGSNSSWKTPNFLFGQPNEFHLENCAVYVPSGRLYDDIYFECNEMPKISGAISPTFKIGNPEIPLQDKIIIKIKTNIQDSLLRDKAVVIRYDAKKDKITSIGGKYREGWMEVKTKDFGQYAVLMDTVAPKISPLNFGKNMKGKKTMSFKITDDLSGIVNYKILIDGQWVLGAYFPRASKLEYRFDQFRLNHGNHSVLVVVEDERGNESVYSSDFVW